MVKTDAERARAYRERKKAGAAPTRWRRSAGPRGRVARWQAAIAELDDVLKGWEAWRESMPPGVAESPTAAALDAVLELRDLVDQLAAAEPPRGFGRD